jgi:hypothetical protein
LPAGRSIRQMALVAELRAPAGAILKSSMEKLGVTVHLEKSTAAVLGLSKNDFMLSRSTASVWPDEAGGCHDRDRLPVRSRLALRAQRQWRRQSQPW